MKGREKHVPVLARLQKKQVGEGNSRDRFTYQNQREIECGSMFLDPKRSRREAGKRTR